ARARLARLPAELRVVGLHAPLELPVERRVVRGDAVVRRALEDDELLRLPGDDRGRLDGRGARADDAHALAREVHALVRPAPRVIPAPLERLEPGELGLLRRGQAARGHDAEARRDLVAAVRTNGPAIGRLVEDRGRHARGELDVAAQV